MNDGGMIAKVDYKNNDYYSDDYNDENDDDDDGYNEYASCVDDGVLGNRSSNYS